VFFPLPHKLFQKLALIFTLDLGGIDCLIAELSGLFELSQQFHLHGTKVMQLSRIHFFFPKQFLQLLTFTLEHEYLLCQLAFALA